MPIPVQTQSEASEVNSLMGEINRTQGRNKARAKSRKPGRGKRK